MCSVSELKNNSRDFIETRHCNNSTCSLIHDKKFTVKFSLQAGDILCFDNRRVLHGRTSFDPNSGQRHLQGYYMDRDEISGRLNFLNKVEV